MLAKASLAVLALLVSASLACGESMTLPVRIAGTNWSGSEDLSGYGPLRFVFSGNEVTMFDRDGATPGTWEQNGDQITMRFQEGRVVYTGLVRGQLCDFSASVLKNADDLYVFQVAVHCRGAAMSGTARNDAGATWNWNAAIAPVPLQVSGMYAETAFGFPIYLDSSGHGSGAAIVGQEAPWPGRFTWDLRLMQP